MNWFLFIAGLVALFTTIGHFTIGSKSFLQPMMTASFDQVPKKVMHAVFHYVSVNLILSAIILLILGFGITFGFDSGVLVKYLAVQYFLYAVVAIIMALTSKIDNALFKLFQWIFFILIAVFAWLGA